jgi:hypothetical protein
VDSLLLPFLIAFMVLGVTALTAAAESRDGFAINDERPQAHH